MQVFGLEIKLATLTVYHLSSPQSHSHLLPCLKILSHNVNLKRGLLRRLCLTRFQCKGNFTKMKKNVGNLLTESSTFLKWFFNFFKKILLENDPKKYLKTFILLSVQDILLWVLIGLSSCVYELCGRLNGLFHGWFRANKSINNRPTQ